MVATHPALRTWPRSARVAALVAALVTALVCALFAAASVGPAEAAASGHGHPTSELHLLAWNDFHGQLEPGSSTLYGQYAGGAAYLARAVAQRQAAYHGRVATVLAGDAIGASQLSSALFHDEPTTVISNLMRVDFAAVGNHEFDHGQAELLRIAHGGCAADGCTAAPYLLPGGRSTEIYPGTRFGFLAANVVDRAGHTLFPAKGVKVLRTGTGRPVPIGFIGETLRETPTLVTPSGVAGLTFTDEADTANRAATRLRAQGVKIPVLLLHQGGEQTAPAQLNGCAGNLADSPVARIAERLDPSIRVIVTGHTHAEYLCQVTLGGVPRLITSAASYGRALTDLTLRVDDVTGELLTASAVNTVIRNASNTPTDGTRQDAPELADPTVAALVQRYVTAAAPLAGRVVGRIRDDLTRAASPLGEQPLGDVVADAQLAATTTPQTGAAQVAVTNPGGLRSDLKTTDISAAGEAPGAVTYGELFAVQPFGNTLVSLTLTGAQLRRLLEQQFRGCSGQTTTRILQISASLRYERAAAVPVEPSPASCAALVGRIRVAGVELQPEDRVRVTVNSFLASGGDGFTVFTEASDLLGGPLDLDALGEYLAAAGAEGLAAPTGGRIVGLGQLPTGAASRSRPAAVLGQQASSIRLSAAFSALSTSSR